MTDTMTDTITLTDARSAEVLHVELSESQLQLATARSHLAEVREDLRQERELNDDLADALLEAAERFDLCGQYERFVDSFADTHPLSRLRRRSRSYDATVEVTLTVIVRVDDITDVDDVADSIDSDTIREALGLSVYSSANVDTWDVTDSEVID